MSNNNNWLELAALNKFINQDESKKRNVLLEAIYAIVIIAFFLALFG